MLCLKRSNYVITAEELAFYPTYQNARLVVDLGNGRKEELSIEATI
jgi:hypothetical protein